MTREATIILPEIGNGTTPTGDRAAHASLINGAVTAFGGVTSVQAYGHWRNDRGAVVGEPVTQYTIAAPETQAAEIVLYSIATTAAALLNQDAVYIRFPSGAVRIVPRAEYETVAA